MATRVATHALTLSVQIWRNTPCMQRCLLLGIDTSLLLFAPLARWRLINWWRRRERSRLFSSLDRCSSSLIDGGITLSRSQTRSRSCETFGIEPTALVIVSINIPSNNEFYRWDVFWCSLKICAYILYTVILSSILNIWGEYNNFTLLKLSITKQSALNWRLMWSSWAISWLEQAKTIFNDKLFEARNMHRVRHPRCEEKVAFFPSVECRGNHDVTPYK